MCPEFIFLGADAVQSSVGEGRFWSEVLSDFATPGARLESKIQSCVKILADLIRCPGRAFQAIDTAVAPACCYHVASHLLHGRRCCCAPQGFIRQQGTSTSPNPTPTVTATCKHDRITGTTLHLLLGICSMQARLQTTFSHQHQRTDMACAKQGTTSALAQHLRFRARPGASRPCHPKPLQTARCTCFDRLYVFAMPGLHHARCLIRANSRRPAAEHQPCQRTTCVRSSFASNRT